MKTTIEGDVLRDREDVIRSATGNTLVMGAFSYFEKADTPSLIVQEVSYKLTPGKGIAVESAVHYRRVGPFGPNVSYVLGKDEIINEFYAAVSARSKLWNRDMQMGLSLHPDAYVFKSQELVRLTIDNYPPTKFDSKGSPYSVVGGPIAEIRLTSKGADWLRRGSCKDIGNQHR